VHNFLVYGLHGKAGSGKTTTANMLCGAATFKEENIDGNVLFWRHTTFAQPLKELISAKRNYPLSADRDRLLYEIARILRTVYGESPLFGAPPFQDLFQLIYDIANMSIGHADDNYRTFQQTVADMIRAYNPDAFANAVKYKLSSALFESKKENESYSAEHPDKTYNTIYIVSDVRYDNECEMLRSVAGGYEDINIVGRVIKLKANKKTRETRLIARDGDKIRKSNRSHSSEDGVSAEHLYTTIDTDNLSQDEVVKQVRSIILQDLNLD
jgi:dephospho-CoA kinase